MSGVAKLEEGATLTPTKVELLATWLPSQPWFGGEGNDVERVAAYRFVDPHDEVGIETLLVRSGGVTYQVPLTYRSEPLEEAENHLIGTIEHSVLGTRYVYDAVHDPVYVSELFRVVHEGDNEADLSRGEKSMTVEGSGVISVANAAGEGARIVRVLDGQHDPHIRPLGTLTGTWQEDGQERTALLAIVR